MIKSKTISILFLICFLMFINQPDIVGIIFFKTNVNFIIKNRRVDIE